MEQLPVAETEDLRFAKALLEHPSLAARLAHAVGTPVERGFELLPARWQDTVQKATRASLERALEIALSSLGSLERRASQERFHKLVAATTGGVGGALGIAALAVELPISTTVMLRSIADVARSEGEPLADPVSRLACLEVFALGGRLPGDDASETGYFLVRASLAQLVSEAARHVAGRGVAARGSPALVRLLTAIAARFGVLVSEKAAAQAIPVLGAAGGALVNTLFIDHFQGVARGHFIVRRLEREHGAEPVRALYERL